MKRACRFLIPALKGWSWEFGMRVCACRLPKSSLKAGLGNSACVCVLGVFSCHPEGCHGNSTGLTISYLLSLAWRRGFGSTPEVRHAGPQASHVVPLSPFSPQAIRPYPLKRVGRDLLHFGWRGLGGGMALREMLAVLVLVDFRCNYCLCRRPWGVGVARFWFSGRAS